MRIRITNWERFQHYKARRPPWIKLHRSLLDDRKFAELSDYASKLLMQCWLIASESVDGTIACDIDDVAFRVHRTKEQVGPGLQELALHGFIEMTSEDDSTVLASRKQVAPESRPETETETKKRQNTHRVYPKEFEEIWSLHHRGPKAKAYEFYRKAVDVVITQEELVKALRAYVRTLDADFRGVHLFRYIRDARWEEVPDEPGALKRNIVTTSPIMVVS